VLAGVDIINDGDNVVIKNNSFYFCRYGVRHSDAQAEHLVIRDNDIMLADVEFACAVNLTDTNHAVIANNDVSVLGNVNASKGIWIHSGCTNTLIKDNTFTVDIDTIVDNDAGTETKEVDSETLSYP